MWVREDPLWTADNIEDGFGTLTIVGELDNVPSNWKGKYNIRYTLPIEIRKNFPNIL